MSNEKMRTDHEEWFSTEYKATYRDKLSGDYDACVIFARSECGWNASRAALCVELPKIVNSEWACTSVECSAMRDAIRFCKHAIESTGVRVK
jgi:hypothetical protein